MVKKLGTYSGDPSTSAKDRYRFLIGDIDCDNFLLSDAEINFEVDKGLSECDTKSNLYQAIASGFAKMVNVTVGKVKKDFKDLYKQYLDLAKECYELNELSAILCAEGFVGGITHSGNQTLNANPDLIKNKFTLDQTDNPEAIQLNQDIKNVTVDSSGG